MVLDGSTVILRKLVWQDLRARISSRWFSIRNKAAQAVAIDIGGSKLMVRHAQ
jgi:hypothetical protein